MNRIGCRGLRTGVCPSGTTTCTWSSTRLPISARATGLVHREQSARHVRLVLAHYAIGDLIARIEILEHDRGAEAHHVGRLAADLDDLGAREAVLDLADARLDHRLLLLGRVVLRVLGDVAVLARAADRGGDRRALDALQAAQLFGELVVTLAGHVHFLAQRASSGRRIAGQGSGARNPLSTRGRRSAAPRALLDCGPPAEEIPS